MKLSIQIGLKTTKKQEQYLNMCAGAARFVHNWGLDHAHLYPGKRHVIRNAFIAEKENYPWVKFVSSRVVKTTLEILEDNIFQWYKGKGTKPKYRKKSDTPFFSINEKLKLTKTHIHIPLLDSGIKLLRPAEPHLTPRMFSFVRHERWYVSIVVDHKLVEPTTGEKTVGIDFGYADAISLYDGEQIQKYSGIDRIKKAERKCRILLRQVRRKQRGSRRYQKFQYKIRKAKAKTYHTRRDFFHKLTTKIVKEYKYIGTRNPQSFKLPEYPTADQVFISRNWLIFLHLLRYKAFLRFVEIAPVKLESQGHLHCHDCLCPNHDYRFRQQFITCKGCNKVYDRDENSAKQWFSHSLWYREEIARGGVPYSDEARNGVSPYTMDPLPS